MSLAAQQRQTDPELEALIPDSALDNPDAWATQKDPSTPTARPTIELDPSSPLDPLPAIGVEWPDMATPIAVEPLTPEPDIATTTQLLGSDLPQVAQASAQVAAVQETHPAERVTFRYPGGLDFADRGSIERRFAELSNLARLRKKNDAPQLVQRRAQADRVLIENVLRNYAYYDADVALVTASGAGLEGRPADTVIYEIAPGKQYLLKAITLGNLAQTGTDYPALRAAYPLNVGDPANGDDIVLAQGSIDLSLGEKGYAFAKVPDPTLTIDHVPPDASLDEPIDTGGRYRFGAIHSADEPFLSARHIANDIARFEPGDLYRRSDMQDLRRALLATGLVSSVTVTPRETAAPTQAADGVVDLYVQLRRAPPRTIAGQIGYDSGEGFRLEGSWEHRNLFPPEGMLRVRGVAGTREQLGGVTFRKNNFGGRDKVLTLDVFAQARDFDAYKGRTLSLIGTYERVTNLLYQKRFIWSVGLEAVATQERDKALNGVTGQRRTFFVGALPGRVGYDTSDDLLDPSRGWRASLRLSPEVARTSGREVFYLRSQADASYYKSVSDGIVLAGRARFGSIQGAGIADIAPSRRLYAGGGGSVRGYGYQAIGPKDTVGAPTGGRSLSELSAEARIRTPLFGGAISVVPFVDAGAVDTTTWPSLQDLRFGAGLGIRYNTGFGPIRLDVATPLNRRKGDSPVAVYVALGQAF